MRLIDADAFRREIDNHWPFTKEEQSKHGIADMAKSTLLYVLNQMPTAQPEIIRCKDCAKRECCRTSTVWAVAPADDWYCADAERRTDDLG